MNEASRQIARPVRQINLTERQLCNFWAKVDKRGPNQCWLWTGCVIGNRYGHFGIFPNGTERAHRIAWLLANGQTSIPRGIEVCHTCDNPPCCNPAHLWLGTHFENMQDMVAKSRFAPTQGTKNGRAKLKEIDAHNIRNEYSAGGVTYRGLARRYGVSKPIIAGIVNFTLWKHVS